LGTKAAALNQSKDFMKIENRDKAMNAIVIIVISIAGLLYWLIPVFLLHEPDTAAKDYFYAQAFNTSKKEPINFEQFRGKLVLVNFWAPWCPPCVQEMPDLSRIQTEYAERGVQVLGIGLDTPEHISQFEKDNPVRYVLFNAASGGAELAKRFGNERGVLPFSVLIAANGEILETHAGKIEYITLKKWLEAALAQSTSR
jgi:thiol-disulfide isomerase/thioredoxin